MYFHMLPESTSRNNVTVLYAQGDRASWLSSYLQTSRGHLRTLKFLLNAWNVLFLPSVFWALFQVTELTVWILQHHRPLYQSRSNWHTSVHLLTSTYYLSVLSNVCSYYSKQYPLKANKFLLLKRLESLVLVKIWHIRLTGRSPSQGTNLPEAEPPWPY